MEESYDVLLLIRHSFCFSSSFRSFKSFQNQWKSNKSMKNATKTNKIKSIQLLFYFFSFYSFDWRMKSIQIWLIYNLFAFIKQISFKWHPIIRKLIINQLKDILFYLNQQRDNAEVEPVNSSNSNYHQLSLWVCIIG